MHHSGHVVPEPFEARVLLRIKERRCVDVFRGCYEADLGACSKLAEELLFIASPEARGVDAVDDDVHVLTVLTHSEFL